MGHNHDVLKSLGGPTVSLREAIPGAWAGFTELHKQSVAEGEVPARLKEAALLAIAVIEHCDGCIAFHAQAAVRAGATRGEIAEMLALAVLMGGGPATVYAPRAWEAYLEFAGELTEVGSRP